MNSISIDPLGVRRLQFAFLALLLCWIEPCRADVATDDFFDIIGKTPKEVASSIPDRSQDDDMEQLVSGFVGLPMSEAHRKEFIEGLRATLQAGQNGKFMTRHCLLNLLEEDSRFDEALAVINDGSTKGDYESIREVAILWKAGKESEAADVARRIAPSSRQTGIWNASTKIDLMTNRSERAMRFLDFLETQPNLPASARYSIALQHLRIARQDCQTDKLIGQSTSNGLKAVWNSALERKSEALENLKHADPEITIPDLELFLSTFGPDPKLIEQTRKVLARSDISIEERRSLLIQFDGQGLRYQLWAGMGGGHAETVDLLDLYLTTFHPKSEVDAAIFACRKILDANPDDSRLQLLLALLSKSEPGQGRSYLLKAARGFVVNPTRSSQFSDPAASALEILAKTSEAGELYKLLTESPGFTQLPLPDRLRYMIAAQLDKPVVDMLTTVNVENPTTDLLGETICGYLDMRAHVCTLPNETVRLISEQLPAIICGSPSKNNLSISRQTDAWLKFFSGQFKSKSNLVEIANRLVQSAEKRSPEVKRAVLSGIPVSIWVLPGLQFAKPEPETRDASSNVAAPCTYLSIFTPPNPSFQLNTMGSEGVALKSFLQPAFARTDFSHRLLLDSPWSQSIRGINIPARFDPEMQARLRMLMNKSPERTLIYDLLVVTSGLNCPRPDVTAIAKERIASLAPEDQIDPAIPVYYFYQRLNGGEPLEKAATSLEGLGNLLIRDRNRVFSTVQQMSSFSHGRPANPAAIQLIRDRLGLKIPEQPQQTPKEPTAYDRLQFFSEAKKLDSPEAVTLAREVLFSFVESNSSTITPTQNIAVRSLVVTGNFPAFLEDLKSRLKAAGKSELDLQRALYHVHLYRAVHNIDEIAPFAKRVMELDPTDLQATQDALEAATLEKNPDLTLKCLETLCHQSRREFLRAIGNGRKTYQQDPVASPLSLFTGPQARKLTDSLLRLPFQPVEDSNYSYQDQDTSGLLCLYSHVSSEDPDRLGPIIRWSKGMAESNWQTLLRFAEYLKGRQRDADAIRILADAFFSPPDEGSDDHFRFKRKIAELLPNADQFNLPHMSKNGWLKPLVEISAAYPRSPATAGSRLLIELAASPSVETWDRLFPPFLASLPVADQPDVQRQVTERLRNIPNSAELQNFLAKTGAPRPGVPPVADVVLQKIQIASEARDPSEIPVLWKELTTLLANKSDSYRNHFITRAITVFATLADDTVWGECLETARKSNGFTAAWVQNNSSTRLDSITDRRIVEFVKLLMPDLKPDERNLQIGSALFTRIASCAAPDPTVLGFFRPWLEMSSQANNQGGRISAKLEILDLLSSDIAAVCPQVFTSPEPDKSWTVDWSLAGFKGMRAGYPYAGKFAFLDKRFDLEILAGPNPDRLSGVGGIEKASPTGSLNLKLPSDAKYVCVVAKEHGGKIVRWSHPILLATPPFGEPVQITPVIRTSSGRFTTMPSGGPFSRGEATEIILNKGNQVDLAPIPWAQGPVPLVSGWFLNSVAYGSLELSFRTSDDVELGTQSLQGYGDELESMPFWQYFKTPPDSRMPAETEKIVLVYKPVYQQQPSTFRLADVKFIPRQVPPLPEGFHPVGRIPSAVGQITMDSLTNRFAVFSAKLGFGLFDLTTNRFSGWTRLQPEIPENPNDIVWAALAGDRLVWVDQAGKMRLFSVSTKAVKDLVQINGIKLLVENPGDIVLSPDGNFIATHGVMAGTRILKISDAGLIGERLMETPQVQQLAFTNDNSTLEIFGGSNQYSLPLAAWDKAELKVANAPFGRPIGDPEMRGWNRMEDTLVDKLQNVTFTVSSNVDLPIRLFPESRKIVLPSGVIALDRERKPFFVSADGNVVRIEIARIEGFGPESEK